MLLWLTGVIATLGILGGLHLRKLQRNALHKMREEAFAFRYEDFSRLQDKVSALEGTVLGLRFALGEDVGRLRKKIEALERREHSHPLGVGSLAKRKLGQDQDVKKGYNPPPVHLSLPEEPPPPPPPKE